MYFKIIKKSFLFLSAKKIWKFPKKNKLLIVDNTGSEKISKCILGHNNYTVLHTRNEVYYWPIILMAFFNFAKYGRDCYRITFIKYVNPKIAITFIDNDPNLPKIMVLFPDCKFVTIMNGRRHENFLSDIANIKNFKIDKYFVFGEDFKNHVKEKIPNTAVSGSILANHFLSKKKFKQVKKIQYISLFQSSYYERDNRIKREWRNLDNSFYEPTTKYTLEILKNFADTNSLKLEIIPRTNWKLEEEYYSKMIDGFEFNKKLGFDHSYKALRDDSIIISCTSTFLMECFGAGYRTGFLTFRQHVIPNDHPEAFRYVEWAWPRKTENHGFFWSNIKEKEIILLVLNNLLKVDEKKWEDITKPFKDKIMRFDPNNTIIKKYLRSEDIKVN